MNKRELTDLEFYIVRMRAQKEMITEHLARLEEIYRTESADVQLPAQDDVQMPAFQRSHGVADIAGMVDPSVDPANGPESPTVLSKKIG